MWRSRPELPAPAEGVQPEGRRARAPSGSRLSRSAAITGRPLLIHRWRSVTSMECSSGPVVRSFSSATGMFTRFYFISFHAR